LAELEAPAWYVVHTRSRHEAKVEESLSLKGIENFLPRLVVPSRRRDRRLLLEVPLFSGYLFVYANLQSEAYYDIIKTKGVVRILGIKGICSPVPQETVEGIRALLASGRPLVTRPWLKRGMRVRIAEGPLTGVTGIILRTRERQRRLVLSVELMQRAVMVDLEDEAVEPLS
jgi:transcription antitermination factor NusG